MKSLYQFFTLLLAASAPMAASAASTEPANSVMSTGKWVKIRVNADGMYQLTAAQLQGLGFEDPSKVKVYGYGPTLLMTHNDTRIPADLVQVASGHTDSKLYFYALGNADYAPELWHWGSHAAKFAQKYIDNHVQHPHSNGATYFLSDVDNNVSPITQLDAPTLPEGEYSVTSTHTSVIYHEENLVNLSGGGAYYSGETLLPSEDFKKEFDFNCKGVVEAEADSANAVVLYQLPGGAKEANQTVAASFSEGITLIGERENPAKMGIVSNHDAFKYTQGKQSFRIPSATTSATLTLQPENPSKISSISIDYWAILYDRKNQLDGDAQALLFFPNAQLGSFFSLDEKKDGLIVWDVTDPLAVKNHQFAGEDNDLKGTFATSATKLTNCKCTKNPVCPFPGLPVRLVAFRPAGELMTPEVIGEVDNQNLRAMDTPDMLIVTSALLMNDAGSIADMHRELQGLEVAVVDQQLIFNEFGSGNISPESVRRFVKHLNSKTPNRLKGILILGPGTYQNSKMVNNENMYVVTAENEWDNYNLSVTTTSCFDAFYGALGDASTDTVHPMIDLARQGFSIPVGRLPFDNSTDVQNFIIKARDYMAADPSNPSMATALMTSDVCSPAEGTHYGNTESAISAIGSVPGLTIHRVHTNFLEGSTQAMSSRMLRNVLAEGVDFMTYFGHGNPTCIGSDAPYFVTLTNVGTIRNPGYYPFSFWATCNAGAYDIYTNTIGQSMVANPYGGSIAMVTAVREVYQEKNVTMGKFTSKAYFNSENGDYMGKIYMTALNDAVKFSKNSFDDIMNHLDYIMIGDPMIPVRRPSHDIAVTSINDATPQDATVYTGASNTIQGNVTVKGTTDKDDTFNGKVVITFYDTPVTHKNKKPYSSGDKHSTYLEEMVHDQEVIGRCYGDVKNGEFTVTFNGPGALVGETGHRISVYAYSEDGSRALGGGAYNLTLTYDSSKTPIEEGEGDKVEIIEFQAGSGIPDQGEDSRVYIQALIRGNLFNASKPMESPVALTIDGKAVERVSNLLTLNKDSNYILKTAADLKPGHHEATLSVRDNDGNWIERTVSFAVDDSYDVNLALDNSETGKLKVSVTDFADLDTKNITKFVVEKMNGEHHKSEAVTGTAAEHTFEKLPAGAYCVYAQVSTPRRVAASKRHYVVVK